MEWFAETMQAFSADMAAGPQWVSLWVNFMGLVFLLAIPFAIIRAEARWTLLVVLLNTPAMLWLYSELGYVRLLGIVHVILWTPLAIYLWRRRGQWRVRETLAGKWIAVLFTTILVSLAFDYADVARYVLGERGIMS